MEHVRLLGYFCRWQPHPAPSACIHATCRAPVRPDYVSCIPAQPRLAVDAHSHHVRSGIDRQYIGAANIENRNKVYGNTMGEIREEDDDPLTRVNISMHNGPLATTVRVFEHDPRAAAASLVPRGNQHSASRYRDTEIRGQRPGIRERFDTFDTFDMFDMFETA